MTADVELLPCPFCGEGEHLLVEHLEGTILHPAHRIRCDNCGASTGYTDKDFRADWNTRANVAHATAAKDAEIEALRAEAVRTEAELHQQAELAGARAERLAEALREAEKDLRQLSVIDCGCKPCRRACRTGRGAEWELESRLETAHAAANKARAALHPTAAQENDDA